MEALGDCVLTGDLPFDIVVAVVVVAGGEVDRVDSDDGTGLVLDWEEVVLIADALLLVAADAGCLE